MDPHGLKLWLIFLAVWVVFWGTAGGIICHKVRGKGMQGALAGAVLAVIGIMLVLLVDEDPENGTPPTP